MENKTYNIKYLPIFERDLDNVIEYILYKLNNKNAALSLLNNVEKAIIQRAKNPTAYEKYNSIKERRYPYYRIYIGNFIIFYVVIGNTMELRRFIYGKRNTTKII